MAIDAWKYGNPEDIADRLIQQSAYDKERKERLREKKSRRIKKLVHKAINK